MVAVGSPAAYCPLEVRVDIQMSVPPNPPCRLEAKTSVRPSPERLGCCSAAVEFRASTFAGVDQESCTLRRVGANGRNAGVAAPASTTTSGILHRQAADHHRVGRGDLDRGVHRTRWRHDDLPACPMRAGG